MECVPIDIVLSHIIPSTCLGAKDIASLVSVFLREMSTDDCKKSLPTLLACEALARTIMLALENGLCSYYQGPNLCSRRATVTLYAKNVEDIVFLMNVRSCHVPNDISITYGTHSSDFCVADVDSLKQRLYQTLTSKNPTNKRTQHLIAMLRSSDYKVGKNKDISVL